MLHRAEQGSLDGFHRYLLVGLKWTNSVLKRWSVELKAAGCSGSTDNLADMYEISSNFIHSCSVLMTWMIVNSIMLNVERFCRNFQVFNQQLLDFWHQEPSLKMLPGPAGDLAKVKAEYINTSLSHPAVA